MEGQQTVTEFLSMQHQTLTTESKSTLCITRHDQKSALKNAFLPYMYASEKMISASRVVEQKRTGNELNRL